MRVSACVGNYATTPYRVPGPDRNVYCMEELCYCTKENAFLLDNSLMNDSLLNWIDKECGLHDLAGILYPLVHKKGSLSAFVIAIFSYVGLYDEETCNGVEQVLKQGAGLSNIEKKKSQIDYLVQKKKFVSAIQEYDNLLALWAEYERAGDVLPAAECLASIWHNKGVALAGMMTYNAAADSFYRAWQIGGRTESYQEFLAAKRMELPENEYVAFAAEHSEYYEAALELEHEVERIIGEWEEHPDYLMLMDRRELRNSTDKQKFFEDCEQTTQLLIDSYRYSVSR